MGPRWREMEGITGTEGMRRTTRRRRRRRRHSVRQINRRAVMRTWTRTWRRLGELGLLRLCRRISILISTRMSTVGRLLPGLIGIQALLLVIKRCILTELLSAGSLVRAIGWSRLSLPFRRQTSIFMIVTCRGIACQFSLKSFKQSLAHLAKFGCHRPQTIHSTSGHIPRSIDVSSSGSRCCCCIIESIAHSPHARFHGSES